MRKSLLILAALAALMIGGCAYGPVNDLPPAGLDAAELVVIRQHAVFGTGIAFDIALDGVDIFGLPAGAYTILKVTPGPHTLIARFAQTYPNKPWEYTLHINPASGERLYFAVVLDSIIGNDIRTTQLTPEEGEKLMRENQYRPDKR